MQVSHMTDVLQTPSMWRLAQLIRQYQQQWQSAKPALDLERFEQELHDHVMALARDLLADALCRDDVTTDEVTVGGMVYRQSLASSATYLTAAGPVTITRYLYRPAGHGSNSICPLELRAGIVDGLWTPCAARQGACVMAPLTPRAGAALFGERGGREPVRSTLDRVPKTLSTHWEAHREVWEET